MSLMAWIRARLRSLFPAPAAPPALPPAPAPSRPAGDDSTPRGDDRPTKRVARLERQLRAAEGRAGTAERETKAARARAAEAEARAQAAEKHAREVEQSAKRAEQSARRATDSQVRTANAEAKARDVEGHERESGARAAKADARVKELEQKLAEAQARTRETEKLLADAEAMIRANPPRAAKPADGATRGGVAEAHFSPGEACLQAIRAQFARARKTVDICVFTITDDRIAGIVLDAHRRGVAVRVITDNDKANDEGSDVSRIARAGVPVRQDQSEYHMHHKFAVFDGHVMLTGSYNWTRGAANFNEENIVVTDEPRLVEAFTGEFEELWRKFAAT